MRFWFAAAFALLAAGALAQTEWLGIYLQGQKVGYSVSKTTTDSKPGREVQTTESKMVIGTQMLGSEMKIVVDSSVTMENGKIARSYYKMASGGRTMEVNAVYSAKQIAASLITESGEEQKTIPIPAGKQVLTDPTDLLVSGRLPPPGKKLEVLLFSPESLDLVSATVEVRPAQEVMVQGRKVMAQVIFVDDPRAPSTLYLSAKGDLIKMTGPLGIEMVPETEEEAKKFSGSAEIDLAAASRLTPDQQVSWDDKKVVLEFSGIDLSQMPSDGRQKVTKSGGNWLVTLTPDRAPNPVTTVAAARIAQPEWVKADTRVPVNDPAILSLAAEIAGGEKTVAGVAKRVHAYVFGHMGVNAGIGVMRDAREILKTKEGVCRDHAILAGTLLRAAGVPTRFANGLVLYAGSYYYHAWVEYWDGDGWVGLDTTRPALTLGTGYIKTSQGTVGQALQGFLLEGATVRVVTH